MYLFYIIHIYYMLSNNEEKKIISSIIIKRIKMTNEKGGDDVSKRNFYMYLSFIILFNIFIIITYLI